MQWILSLLSAPFFNLLLKGWQMKLEAAGKSGAQAADVAKAAMLAEVELRKANKEIIIAQQGAWYTAWPMVLVQASAALYFCKGVVWDTMLGLGTTPAIHGDLQTTYTMVMSFWFGSMAVKGAIVTARTWWR